ncbi:hypothetical protein [Mycolicibacterium thermoresistibile]
MIDAFLAAVAVALVLNLLVSGTRILLGPSGRDRLTALLLLSSTGAAVLAVLAAVMDVPALRDAALATVALAAVIVVVRVAAERQPTEPGE